MKIEFAVKSSAGEPYMVSVIVGDGKMVAFCTCQAGVFHKLCKHIVGVLSGDESVLCFPDDAVRLPDLRSLVARTDFDTFARGIQEQEAKVQEEQAILKALKKEWEQAVCRRGMPLA